ncbi:tetratricopeptide repeat protein [Myxococcus sp. Y35]|uniref:tetratricopeptide repeat protein n=1 Tax=Pseudomyxococcus flavus TaxID=3115648 RepID=UPI003CF4B5D4
MTTRAKGRGETSPADDEFLQQLSRGGELLAAGRVHEAQPFLERAHQLQPRMEKAQNLLGLCYFKLGQFDRAAELYEMLVRDNPVDPTLRVNLGLVYLKTNALQRAAREFETATDLAPEHQKAQNYLGLALAQMGEYGRAREHFLLAGSEVMAEKMSRAIAGEAYAKPAPAAPAPARGRPAAEGSVPRGGAVESPRPTPPAPVAAAAEPEEEEIRFAEDEGPSALTDAGPAASTAGAADRGDQEPPPESAFDETSAAVAASTSLTPVPVTKLQLRRVPADSLNAPAAPVARDAAEAHAAPEGAPHGAATPAREAPAPRGSPTSPRDGAVGTSGLERGGAGTLGPATPAAALGPSAPTSEAAAALGASTSTQGSATSLAASAPGQGTAVASLAELAASAVLAGADASRPFRSSPDCFALAVEGELLTRLDGLVALGGQLTFTPEMKRFRGRATDKSFGEGAARMVRAKGSGVLYLAPAPSRAFLAVDLGEESAYFRDECVFAFEEPVMFENGRVPSDIAPDLDLVHLRGQGRVLLSLPGPLRSVAVRQEHPVTVPLPHLVGWQGNLTPRMVPLLKSPTGETLRAGVELSGEGFALIALAVR